MGALTFLCFFFNIIFLKVNCGLYIVSSVWGKIMIPMYSFDYMACMDYMDPNVHCPKKAVKFNHSLTHLADIFCKRDLGDEL